MVGVVRSITEQHRLSVTRNGLKVLGVVSNTHDLEYAVEHNPMLNQHKRDNYELEAY